MNFSLRISERQTLLIVVDLVLVNATTVLALWIWSVRGNLEFDRAFLSEQIEWFFLLSALWAFSSFVVGLYDLTRITDLVAAANALLRTITLVVIAYLAIYFFLPGPGALPRGVVLYQGVSSFILIGLWRALYMLLIRRPAFARKAIIVGAGNTGQEIAQAIHRHANAHYQILGFVDDDPAKQSKVIQISTSDEGDCVQLPVLGAGQDLVRLTRENQVPELVLAITNEFSATLFDALLECKVQGVEITLMPELYEQLTGQVPIDHIGKNWNVALPLSAAEAGGWYPISKRVFDIVGALSGLVFFFPLLPFLMLAIFLDSPGPIFYSQVRAGKGGRLFQTFKLRTMVLDAEKFGAQQAERNDPRITRVGRWLRKLRLDEMPQLFNVLKGEMSAVGPRPERPEHLKEFDRDIPFHRLRNSVKPGMAGWAVINYGYIESVADARIRLQYDLYYIKHQSLWLDTLILLRTFGSVLAFRGR